HVTTLVQFVDPPGGGVGRQIEQLLGVKRAAGQCRLLWQRFAGLRLQFGGFAAGSEREEQRNNRQSLCHFASRPAISACAAAIASRTRSGAVPPADLRAATDASTERQDRTRSSIRESTAVRPSRPSSS